MSFKFRDAYLRTLFQGIQSEIDKAMSYDLDLLNSIKEIISEIEKNINS